MSCISMPLIMFIACIRGIGAFMGNSTLGITTWLSSVFTPVFSSVSPTVFMLVLLSFSALLSNFCTAAVPMSLTFAIATPLCAGIYAGQVNPLVMAALTTVLGSCAWTTAPSSPISAISYGSGWVIPRQMIKWGLITTLICIAVAMTLGVAIGNTF